MAKSERLDNLGFEPVESMMVGPTEIRGDNKYCANCLVYFGSGLSLSHPVCVACHAVWPRSQERTEAEHGQVWRNEESLVEGERHVVMSCFAGNVHHHPEGKPAESKVTGLEEFLATFRFLEEKPS